MKGIFCSQHGVQLLSPNQYRQCLVDEDPWRCPTCDQIATLFHANNTVWEDGCLQCKSKPAQEGWLYDEQMIGFFCDKFCQHLYHERINKGFHKRVKQ